MKIDVFNKVVKEQLLVCGHLLIGKGHEYAPDAVDESNIDRLAHFKKAAAIIDGTPKEALLGMLAKHLVSSRICVPMAAATLLTAGLRKSRTALTTCF